MSDIDSDHQEIYLLGDLNCDMLDSSSHVTKRSNLLMESYQLSQVITQPTRVTQSSSTLIDVCITSNPEHIILSDVISLGISDHNLIHVVRKSNSVAKTHSHKSVRVRNFKNFNANSFQEDLVNEPWHLIELQSNIDLKWSLWKFFFWESLTNMRH
jgi:hypothetical protein